GAILNGLALSKIRPYGSGFLIFSDYGRAPIRLAAIMEIPLVYVFTHDSIGVGEDGPTHQPIEQLPSLRAIPGLITIRPVDANEYLKAMLVKALVVSMPTWDIFEYYCEKKDPGYRNKILPPMVTARVSVEQASTFGWARYVGLSGQSIGMRTFGASAPLKEL